MAPEWIGVPPGDFSRHDPVTPTQPTGRSPLSTSSPATDAHASIITTHAGAQIKNAHVTCRHGGVARGFGHAGPSTWTWPGRQVVTKTEATAADRSLEEDADA